jgi:hypothetical protein
MHGMEKLKFAINVLRNVQTSSNATEISIFFLNFQLESQRPSLFHVSSSYKTVPLPVANRVCTDVISRRQAIAFQQTAVNCCGCIKLICLLIIIFIFWFFFTISFSLLYVSMLRFYCHYFLVFSRTSDSVSDCAAPSLPF